MIKEVKIIEVIMVKAKKGTGTKNDPIRVVTQYWDKENNLLFEVDICR